MMHISSLQTVRRVAVAVFGFSALVAFALPRGGAMASQPFHLRLTKSEPTQGDTVTSPKAVRLWFSLQPQMSLTSIRLRSTDGTDAMLGAATFSGELSQPVEATVRHPLAAGRYTVAWKTASKDMHPVTGEFSFVVR
ncbi:MAG: copper resistance CopC family protein [Gemmatimonadaceae bacterium]